MKQIRVAGQKLDLPKTLEGWTIEQRPGSWMILTNPQGERVRMQAVQFREQFWVHGDGKTIYGSQVQQQRSTGTAAGGDHDLTAQFPGKVRKILVQAGETVEAGTPLILLEAMKMEFSVKAPAAGKVKAWKVKEGDPLSPGAQLLDFKESKK